MKNLCSNTEETRMNQNENAEICHCKHVSVADIERALGDHTQFEDVEKQFRHVQEITHCSTGCGGCHDKILDVISDLMNA